MQKLPHFFTKMAITSTRKVQIPKFWCLKSSTSIWPSFGNINSIQKVKNMELEQREGSKLAKIGQFFALKKLNLHFLKNFPRFDFTAFFCDFQCIRPIKINWQSSWYRTGVVGGMHWWLVHVINQWDCYQRDRNPSGFHGSVPKTPVFSESTPGR